MKKLLTGAATAIALAPWPTMAGAAAYGLFAILFGAIRLSDIKGARRA